MRKEPARSDRKEQHDEHADGDVTAREREVTHSSIVAVKVARLGDDFVPKARQTVCVFAFVLTAALALSTSGLHGTVVIDPAKPVCIVGQSCSAPDKYDVLAFERGGRRIAQVRTNAYGKYRVALHAGVYAVTAPRRNGIGRGLQPRRVVVPSGRYARANFTLDIGIR
jgi:hypothetical protein